MADFDPEAFLADGADEFDPAAFVGGESTATRSDVAPTKAPVPAPAQAETGRLAQLLDAYRKARGAHDEKGAAENEALAVNAATAIPKLLGVRNDLGNLGAAAVDLGFDIKDKWDGIRNSKTFGELRDNISRDDVRLPKQHVGEVKKFYGDIEADQPLMSSIGTGLGTAPVAPFRAGATALTAGKTIAPFAAKLITAGASGLDAGLVSGVLGYRDSKAADEEGKRNDAYAQAILGGAAGAAGAIAPEAISSGYQLGKQGLGKLAQAPRQGLQNLYAMLGGKAETAPAVGASLSGADAAIGRASGRNPSWQNSSVWDDIEADDAVLEAKLRAKQGGTKPIAETAKPAATPNPDYDTGAMKHVDSAIDSAGKGDLPPNKDPEFLRKSKELADMLKDGDTAMSAVPSPGPRGPDIKHKGAYRGQQFKFPEDKAGWERQPAAWKAGEDASDIPPVSKAVDELFFADQEGPDTQAAIEALKRFEMNASKQRWGVGHDSNVAAQPKSQGAGFDVPTGQGAADMYQPMGAPESARAAAEKTAAREALEHDTALIPLGKERMKWLNERGYTSEGNPLYSSQDVDQIAQQVNAKGSQNFAASPWDHRSAITGTNQPWFSPSMPSTAGADALITPEAARSMGRDRLRGWVGNAGMVSGGYEGLKHGGLFGMAGGAAFGEKAAIKAFDKADKWSEKLAELGGKLLKDPAKLVQLEAQGGKVGKGAAFVLEGYRSGGEAGGAARAFILMSQPWWRAQFAEPEEQPR